MAPNITDNEDFRPGENTKSNRLKEEEQSKGEILEGSAASKISTNGRCIDEDPKGRKKGFFNFETELKWNNIILITLLHVIAIYAALTFNYLQDLRTTLFITVMQYVAGFGITATAHRYWTHRTYKAKRPFQVFMVICYAVAGQNKILDWVRDHRVHHKYSDTDADPHNINRGFFFAHVGWLMMKKHPEVIKKGQQIDVSDITSDPLLVFADKHLTILQLIFCFLIPTLIPVYGWNETWSRAIMSQCFIRYVSILNSTWSVNSLAHYTGTKPYDKSIKPSDNLFVAYVAGGEGWHNYHHTFPWDYRTGEMDGGPHNVTTLLIDMFAKFGFIYDRKSASRELVKSVSRRKGDGSRQTSEEIPVVSLIVDKYIRIPSNSRE